MADLLSRLAARAAGTAAPGAGPRLPSLFEGGGVAGADVVSVEAETGTSTADVGAATAALAPPRDSAGEPAPAPVRAASARSVAQTNPEAARPAPVSPAAAPPMASPPLAPPARADRSQVVRWPVPPTVPAAPAATREPSARQESERVPAVAVPRDPGGAPDLPRAPAQPMAGADAPPQPAGDRHEPTPTVITISIGRLEVRAVPAEGQRPASPRPAPHEPARVGLHDYLRGVREPR